jgi:UDP-glucose 4-epimerase
MKKILITGASGYIGSYLSDYLYKTGKYELTILVRTLPKYLKNIGESIKIIECDILDYELMTLLIIDKYDAIIHLAAFNDVDTINNPQKALLTNAFGTKNLLKIASNLEIKNFIYFSVLQVYGRELEGSYTSESEVLCDNDYSLNHFIAEEYCKMFSNSSTICTSIIRLAYAFGCPIDFKVDRWTLVPESFCLSAILNGEIILNSSGKAERDFVPINYVSKSVEYLIENYKKGYNVYNLTSEVIIPIIETAHLVQEIAEEVLQKKIKLIINSDQPTKSNFYNVKNNLLGPLSKNQVLDFMKLEMRKIFLLHKNTKYD